MLAQIRPGAGRRAVIAMEVYLRDPAPDLRAAAAAGVVRAGGDTNLADLYVLFKENDARPALAALRELRNACTPRSRPSWWPGWCGGHSSRSPSWPPTSCSSAGARDSYGGAQGVPRAERGAPMRGRALVVADDATLRSLAADPNLGIWVYRARLLRGEPDLAADWFIAYGTKLPPAAQADAMNEWIAHAPPPAAPVTATPTPAAPAAEAVPRPRPDRRSAAGQLCSP